MMKSALVMISTRKAVCLVKPRTDLAVRSLVCGSTVIKSLISPNLSNPKSVIATPRRTVYTNDPVKRPDLNLTYEQFAEIVKEGKHQIFDIRDLAEVEQTGKITEQATRIPISEVSTAFKMTPEKFKEKYGVDIPGKEDGNVVLYCLAGVRSMGAIAMLTQLGHKGCRHFPGGWAEWEKRQKEMEQ